MGLMERRPLTIEDLFSLTTKYLWRGIKTAAEILTPRKSNDWTMLDAKEEKLTDEKIQEFISGKRNGG